MSDPPEVTSAPPTAIEAPRVLPMLLGFAVIFYLFGGASAEFGWYPYRQLVKPAYSAVSALQKRLALTESRRETDLWRVPTYERRGVVKHDPDLACPGLTLYTSGHDSAAFLIDMEGKLKHHWRLPFHDLWKKPPHVARPVPEPFIHWRRAHLFPNGDLIAMYEAAGDTPWGYGLVKVDKDSNVLWSTAENIHHDFCIRPDGSILALSHQWRDSHQEPVSEASNLGRVLLDDFVLVISPDGKVQQRISILDAIDHSRYSALLLTVPENEWDFLHNNTVELITPEFARHHDFAQAGQVMLSLRSRQALAILDLEDERVTWADCGPFRSQHDPDVLPNGNILLFDNRGHSGPEKPSRVIEYNPKTTAIHWSFAGTEEDPMFSLVRSTQQSLPNGNVLITESDGGRILEVTRQHEVVWEFHNPACLPDGDPSVAIVCGAQRLNAGDISFQFNEPSNLE